MDPRVDVKVLSAKPPALEKCIRVSSAAHTQRHSSSSGDYAFNMNDRATLLSNYLLKDKICQCPCSCLSPESKTNSQISQPWITVLHIMCSVSKH